MPFLRRKQDLGRLESRTEARRREDAAPRLRDVVPGLRSLRFHFQDRRQGEQATLLSYTKHVMVNTGPALFVVRCPEPRCSGQHDLTAIILGHLEKAQPRYEGESRCQGLVDDSACVRVLFYVSQAEFQT